MTIVKWGMSGQDISSCPGFQDSYCLNLQRAISKILTLSAASIFVTEGLLYTFISCHLKKIIEIGFPELEKKFSNDFAPFL